MMTIYLFLYLTRSFDELSHGRFIYNTLSPLRFPFFFPDDTNDGYHIILKWIPSWRKKASPSSFSGQPF